MIHRASFLLLVLIAPSICFSQNTEERTHSLFLELGGPASLESLNYDHQLWSKDIWSAGGRVGLGFNRFQDYNNRFNPDFALPFGLYGALSLLSQDPTKPRTSALLCELGAGFVFTTTIQADTDLETIRENKLNTYLYGGLRYNMAKGLFVRAAYTPLFSPNTGWNSWGAISIGYSFK